VRITDFGVLVALAFVSFSALWSRKPTVSIPHSHDTLPISTGIGCLLVAGALYFVDTSVVLFGIIFIMIGYLLFDIFELGSYGSQIFLAVLFVVLFGVTGIIAKSDSIALDPSTVASLSLIRNVLEAAIFMFAINILIGTRFYQHIGSFVSEKALKTRAVAKSLFTRIRRLRKGTELDRTIDRRIRLMEDSDRISSQDPDNFTLIKNHLEARLSSLRRDRKTSGEDPSRVS